MSPDLLSKINHRTVDHFPPAHYLDTEVGQIMTTGVVSVPASAPLRDVYRALVTHRIHAVVVADEATGKPLGWVTARGLLDWMIHNHEMVCARDAITHEPACIRSSATVREAWTALEQPGINQLLVADRPGLPPQGVLSDLDIIALAAR
jgi:CBS domain-containing protein